MTSDIVEWAPLAARIVVAAVFAVAAVAKLADVRATRSSLSALGAPARLARPGAVALPLAELAVACTLVPAATARPGAIVALIVLAVFSAALARVAARRDVVGCRCFGALGSARPSLALVRNGLLGMAAAAVAIAGPGRGIAEVGGTAALVALAVVVVAGQTWVSWQLLRQNGRLLNRVRALEEARESASPAHARVESRIEVGEPAPHFALPDADGARHTLDDLLVAGRPLALAFSDPECGACASLPASLARIQAQRTGELELALVTRRGGERGPFAPTLVQDEHEVARAYGAGHVPCALLIAPDGRIASPLAVGDLAIEDLLTPRTLEAVS